MPHNLSAKKRLRQDENRRIRNKSIKTEIKTRSKKLAQAVAEKDVGKAQEIFRAVVSTIDKAKKRRVYHSNKAARLESKLARLLKTLPGEQPEGTD